MLNAKQNELMLKAVEMLEQADVLIQQALGASDECYELHNAIENTVEDVLEYIQEHNSKEVV